MTIAWTTVEDAIHDWIVSATSLANDHVIWGEQNSARPVGTFVDMEVALERIGMDWVEVDDAAVPAPGAEIDNKVRGIRRMEIQLRCFGIPATGTTAPRALLDSVVAAYRLPNVHAALVVAGVGISNFSSVTNITGVLNSTKLEPRELFNVSCFLSSEVSETGTYIQDVEVTDQISVPDNVFTVEGP